MRIIKLNAIDSTNDYLKRLSRESAVANFTVVYADVQTRGKGQMGSIWFSEPGKNLTMSILVSEKIGNAASIFTLNVAVAVSICNTLDEYRIPELTIKWPNDIMAGKMKIGGILIENTLLSGGNVESVVGIGINVNQTNFSQLPKAASVASIIGIEFSREEMAINIANNIKQAALGISQGITGYWWTAYREKLFRKDVPMPFESEGTRFMGIIRDVQSDGRLVVELENGSVNRYGIKDISMLY